jgi:beta-lactamase regulating signal transducer with metallopeptidase domain/type II secretory pathway component GspD/PulD (secretin)
MMAARLQSFAGWIADASWHAAIVVGVVLIVRQLSGRRLPPAWRCALWVLVAARLLLFIAPEGSLSLFTVLENGRGVRSLPPISPVETGVADRSANAPFTVHYGPIPGLDQNTSSFALPTISVARSAFHLRDLAVLVWLVGALVLFIRVAVIRRKLGYRIDHAPIISDPACLALLDCCRREMKVTRAIALRSTSAVSGPALSGVAHPSILLPPGLHLRLTSEQLRFVFLHELSHVRRHDLLVEWLITLLTCVHWFNPAIWLAAHLYRSDRELARDEMVLRASGPQSHQSYGHTLLSLLETLGPSIGSPPLALTMLGGKDRLKQRISMIAQLRRTPSRIVALVLLLAFAFTAWVVLTNPRHVASNAGITATAPASRPDGHDAPANPQNELARVLLDRRLPEINFEGQGLSDVIDFLRDVSGADFAVDWRALEAAGIEKDTPVTARLRNITLAKALNVLLGDAGGGKVKLGFLMEGGVIAISTVDGLPKNVVTTVYDMRDLVASIPDFDSEKDFPFRDGKNAPPPTTAPAKPTVNPTASLIDLIRSSIDPESWQSAGGHGSIKETDGQFVITQSPQNHQEIVQLLNQLREGRNLRIMVSTQFVSIDPAALTLLPAALRDKILPALHSGERPVGAPLTDAEVNKLLQTMQGLKSCTILSTPRLTLFNGQRAYIVSQTQRAYAADLQVIRNKDNSVKYDPIVKTASSGILLDVKATVSADRRFVTASLRPRFSELVRMETRPFDKIPPDQKGVEPRPTVQHPVMRVRDIKTTVSIPDGGTLLLGGDAFAPLPEEDGVPILSDIPLIKPLFSNLISSERQMVLILIKPKILIATEQERPLQPAH